ncbi:TolC family protein [Alistipes timonensis]
MLKKICSLVVVSLLIGTFRLQGQTVWTLEQCISHAQSHNVSIKQQELDIQNAQIALQQSKLDYIPSLGVNSGYNLSMGRVLDPTTYEFIENNTVQDFNASASLSTELFAGFKKLYAKHRAALNLQSVLNGIEKAKNDLALNVTGAYLDVLLADENIRIVESKITLLQTQEVQTRQLVDAGKITLGELLQIQAQIADAQGELLGAQNRRETAALNICQMLEIDDYESFRVISPNDVVISAEQCPFDFEEVRKSVVMLPQIRKAQIDIRVAEKDISIAKAAMSPTLSITGGYGSSFSDARQKMRTDANGNPVTDINNNLLYTSYPFIDQIRDNASSYISLSLNIPIFNSRQAKNKVRVSRISKQRAEYNLLLTQKQLDKDVQQSLIDARTALQKYYSSEANVETNEESFRYVQQKLDVGAATYVDYQIALDNMMKAKSQLLQAKYEYIMRKQILNFYMGETITLK